MRPLLPDAAILAALASALGCQCQSDQCKSESRGSTDAAGTDIGRVDGVAVEVGGAR